MKNEFANGENKLINDFEVDRQRLFHFLLNDPKKLSEINNFIMPFIKKKISSLIAAKNKSILFIESPLISNLENYFDLNNIFTIQLKSSNDILLQRIMERNLLSSEKARVYFSFFNSLIYEIPNDKVNFILDTSNLNIKKTYEKIIEHLKIENIITI